MDFRSTLKNKPLHDRTAVEAVKRLEQDGDAWSDDEQANRKASEASPPPWDTPPRKAAVIAHRARRLLDTMGQSESLGRVRKIRRVLLVAWVVLGLIAGALTASAALAWGGTSGQDAATPLNIFIFLSSTVGLHTLILALSLLMLAWAYFSRNEPWLAKPARWVASRTWSRKPLQAETTFGAWHVLQSGRRGLWSVAVAGNLGGLAFSLSVLGVLVLSVTFRDHYVYYWLTSLPSGMQSGVLAFISGPLEVFGLQAIDEAMIQAARAGGDLDQFQQSPAHQEAWSLFLIHVVLVWMVLPRVWLAAVSWLVLWDKDRRPELELHGLYYGEVLNRIGRAAEATDQPDQSKPELIEDTEHLGRAVEATDQPDQSKPELIEYTAPAKSPPVHESVRPLGAPLVIRYEFDRPNQWPPSAWDGITDGGLVDGAANRRETLQKLDDSDTQPSSLIVVVSRGEVPARAEKNFLAELVKRGGDRVAVVMTLSPSLAIDREDRNADRIESRTKQWRQAAIDAGVDPQRVVEAELSKMSDVIERRLKSLLAGNADEATTRDREAASNDALPTPRLQQASSRIKSARPITDNKQLASVIDDLSKLYGAEKSGLLPDLSNMLPDPPKFDRAPAVVEAIEAGASRLALRLPSWLSSDPRWMVGGALLSTVATVAGAIALGGPLGAMTVANWPLYSAAGAVLGKVLRRQLGSPTNQSKEEDIKLGEIDDDARLRAAVLHALVLELQPLPDADAARVLDRVLQDWPDGGPIDLEQWMTDGVQAGVASLGMERSIR